MNSSIKENNFQLKFEKETAMRSSLKGDTSKANNPTKQMRMGMKPVSLI
jgi:hypothetical protein